MVTIEERRKARQAKSKAKFIQAGKTKATSLSRTAEVTAQRRGRGFDPLETVILQAVVPPPPPPPPKPKTRQQSACDILGGIGSLGGGTVARGVSFGCGNKPIGFTSNFSSTTVRVFGQSIQSNRAKLRAAGFGDQIPFDINDVNSQKRTVKILRRKRDFAGINRFQASICKSGRGGGTVSKRQCKNLGLQGFNVTPVF